MDNSLNQIIQQIDALSEGKRRTLLRRLRVNGLLPVDALATDKNRLLLAPSLTSPQRRTRRSSFVAPQSREPSSAPPDSAPPHDDAAQAEQAEEDDVHHSGPYQSPVRGRIVVGVPAAGAKQTAPAHEMPPLPGQAPERAIGIIFDGGSRGNPGRGYGSYALRWPGQAEQIVQLQFGDRVTNNEAEYDTLIAALEAVLKRLGDGGVDSANAKLDVRGDSLLVINQVKGEWKVKNARMRVRRERARELIDRFGQWRLTHHDRSNSVRVLGH